MKTKLPKPTHSFLITPLSTRFTVAVYIWKTKKEMLVIRRHWGYKGECEAYCNGVHACSYKGKKRRTNLTAEVHCYQGFLGITVISHELFHATLLIARRLSLNLCALYEGPTPTEERIAHIHSDLCRMMTNKLYELNLVKR